MLALVNTPGGNTPVELREVAEPQPAPNEALVEVRAFSLNRGELRLFQIRPEGWRPGQDISGVVRKQAADGSGPAAGTRVVALTDNAGWARARGRAGASDGRIAGQCQLRGSSGFAGRRFDRAAQLASRCSFARQAGADHRCGRRCRAYGRSDRREIGCPRYRHRWGAGARPPSAWCCRDRRRHRSGERPVRADPRIRRRGFARRRNRPHRGERDDRDLRQFVW